MPASAAHRATASGVSTPTTVISDCNGPNINPLTGFSTDYLNHFTETVMILEMAGDMPECLDDLRTWRPKTYIQHFAASRFSNREAVIDAYHEADPSQRRVLEQTAAALNTALIESRDALLAPHGDVAGVVLRVLERLRPLIAQTAAVLNGTAPEAADRDQQQAAIDAMFGA
jgi:hypothetical protein